MTSLLPSFVYRSSAFLQVTMTIIKGWTSLNLGKIPSPTTELAALDCESEQ